jgi:hypothetical protein
VLPSWVKNTKTCVNVQNHDQMCFGYAVASSETARLTPEVRDQDRVTKHVATLATLNLTGICTAGEAAKCSQTTFRRFERQNPEYALLVLSTEQASKARDLAVQYNSPHYDDPAYRSVCLLFIEATAAEAPGHYVWCKNPRVLLGQATGSTHRARRRPPPTSPLHRGLDMVPLSGRPSARLSQGAVVGGGARAPPQAVVYHGNASSSGHEDDLPHFGGMRSQAPTPA